MGQAGGTRKRFAVALVALALGASAALGYQREGHLFTTALTLGPGLSSRQAQVVAFCSQLPDETTEYDATSVYAHQFRPSFGDDEEQWMIAVQELLHALTGGDAGTMQTCAAEVVSLVGEQARTKDDVVSWCALGFAIHLLGDSYAHQEMGQPGQLYRTGWGHAGDYHEPDLPFYEPAGWHGTANWKAYVERLAGLPMPVARSAVLDQFLAAGSQAFSASPLSCSAAPILSDSSSDEAVRQQAVQQALQTFEASLFPDGGSPTIGLPTAQAPGPPLVKTFLPNLPCEQFLAFTRASAGAHLPVPDEPDGGLCAPTWTLYRKLARDVLATPDCASAFANPPTGDALTKPADYPQ